MKREDLNKLEELILDEIKIKKSQQNILVLFGFNTDIVKRIIEETDAKISLVSNNLDLDTSDRIDRWAEEPESFLELIRETQTKFDFILIINPEKYYEQRAIDLSKSHKEIVRNAQQHLTETGVLIFATQQRGFVLDDYIRPGADKLTKRILSEEERKISTLQAFAFYK